MGLVTREILSHGRKTERVAVPEWDGEITIRALSAAQQITFAAYVKDLGDAPGGMARSAAWMLTAAWVDEDGKPVLPLGDVDALLESQTAELLVDLGLKISAISGFTPNATVSAEKNSESSQS